MMKHLTFSLFFLVTSLSLTTLVASAQVDNNQHFVYQQYSQLDSTDYLRSVLASVFDRPLFKTNDLFKQRVSNRRHFINIFFSKADSLKLLKCLPRCTVVYELNVQLKIDGDGIILLNDDKLLPFNILLFKNNCFCCKLVSSIDSLNTQIIKTDCLWRKHYLSNSTGREYLRFYNHLVRLNPDYILNASWPYEFVFLQKSVMYVYDIVRKIILPLQSNAVVSSLQQLRRQEKRVTTEKERHQY